MEARRDLVSIISTLCTRCLNASVAKAYSVGREFAD